MYSNEKRETIRPPFDIVFISLESWDDVWRRNQFLSAEYAVRHPNTQILFVTPPRDITNAIRRREWHRLRSHPIWSPTNHPNIHVFQPTKAMPNSLALGRLFNTTLLRQQIRVRMRALSIRKPLLWVNDHAAGALLGSLQESLSIYDVTDDWISFYPDGPMRSLVQRQDAYLCKNATATIVCSTALLAMKQKLAHRLTLIPNGVDVDHYRAVAETRPNMRQAAKWLRPIFGYTGTIHNERVDINLIDELAKHNQGTFVFVGPDMLTESQRAVLSANQNVVLMGTVSYQHLPEIMKDFDVCIVPHRMTNFTNSLNPIKLWEYLAAGKPIVSTNVAGFRDFPDLVHLASNVSEFSAALKAALDEPDDRPKRRIQIAAMNSWTSRLDAVERLIDELRE